MKRVSKSIASVSGTESQKPSRKKRRRHTRIHLEALRPQCSMQWAVNDQCPKCQGLMLAEGGESLSETVIRCLNCGWQPQHRLSLIEESDEAKAMRSLTVLIGSGGDPLTPSVNF